MVRLALLVSIAVAGCTSWSIPTAQISAQLSADLRDSTLTVSLQLDGEDDGEDGPYQLTAPSIRRSRVARR